MVAEHYAKLCIQCPETSPTWTTHWKMPHADYARLTLPMKVAGESTELSQAAE
jgi:hypothetical protein